MWSSCFAHAFLQAVYTMNVITQKGSNYTEISKLAVFMPHNQTYILTCGLTHPNIKEKTPSTFPITIADSVDKVVTLYFLQEWPRKWKI